MFSVYFPVFDLLFESHRKSSVRFLFATGRLVYFNQCLRPGKNNGKTERERNYLPSSSVDRCVFFVAATIVVLAAAYPEWLRKLEESRGLMEEVRVTLLSNLWIHFPSFPRVCCSKIWITVLLNSTTQLPCMHFFSDLTRLIKIERFEIGMIFCLLLLSLVLFTGPFLARISSMANYTRHL